MTQSPTYYDRPVLKQPVWIWAVPVYFYVGGVAGAAVVLSEAAGSLSDDVDDLVRRGRWTGAIGAGAGSALLIYDLGRPERFLNMLRVFRPTSPMSVGSWILALAAPVFAVSAVLPHAGTGWGRLGRLAGRAAAALGLPLATYTSVLLSTTAVPVWQAGRRILPFVFASSAASSAAAVLELTPLNEREAKIVGRFGAIADAVELAACTALERAVGRLPQVGKALESGPAGALWRTSTATTVASLALAALPGSSRRRSVAGGVLGTAGGLALRASLWLAGRASAADPRATFASQRAEAGRGDGRSPS